MKTGKYALTLLFLVGLLGLWTLVLTVPRLGFGQTYNETVIVNTTVNITNSAPMISSVVLDSPISLVAYGNKTVFCNATVFDWDNQTLSVNATLYIDGISQPSSNDDGNNHYTNTSCSVTSNQDRIMNYSCAFHVQYYADNSSNWRCNVTALDTGNAFASNFSNAATVLPLVAIKIPTLLDYGDLAVNEVSNDTLANITNVGNRNANISVKGYGETEADGLAFVCSFGSIPLSYERYNITSDNSFANMIEITDYFVGIQNFYVPQQTIDYQESTNITYWKVQIPVGAAGVCNGKLVFEASDRG